MASGRREYLVGAVEDFPEGTHRVVRAGNREIGIFNIQGEYHALPNLCPHQRGPLCAGEVSGTLICDPDAGGMLAWVWEGEVIVCPWHGLEFNVISGRCVALPEIRLRKFEIRIKRGELHVLA